MAAVTSCELQDEEINAEKIISVNPLSPKIDQHQISPCNINAL